MRLWFSNGARNKRLQNCQTKKTDNLSAFAAGLSAVKLMTKDFIERFGALSEKVYEIAERELSIVTATNPVGIRADGGTKCAR